MRFLNVVLASFVLVLFSSCGDIDAGGPAGPDPQPDYDYFPFAVGNNWNIVRTGSGSEGGEEYTVTGISSVSVDRIVPHTAGFDVFEVVTTGVDTLHFKVGDVPQEPYSATEYIRETDTMIEGYPDTASTKILWTIPIPLEVGDTWLYTSKPMDIFAFVLSVTENLSVPAGSFEDVLLIETKWMPELGAAETVDQYFGPEVGFIAREDSLLNVESGDWFKVLDELASYNIE